MDLSLYPAKASGPHTDAAITRIAKQRKPIVRVSFRGAYAFVVNHRGPSGEEITDQEIYETCNKGLDTLGSLGILPVDIKKVEKASYNAVLYSAIDVLEPRTFSSFAHTILFCTYSDAPSKKTCPYITYPFHCCQS